MSFKCSNCYKVVYDHFRLNFNASNESLCSIGVKYQHTIGAVCAYAHVVRKRPGCALIGACAPIRTNTVVIIIVIPSNSTFQILYNTINFIGN